MRKVLPVLLVMLCSQLVIGQNVGINNNTPDASSILDVTSTDKGVLLPRVSLTDVTDNTSPIASPAEGLLIYNTNDTVVGGDGVGFYYFDGTEWVKLISDAALTVDGLSDADNDTKIQVEETSDEDTIRFDVAGTEYFKMHTGRLEVLNTGGSVFIGEGAGASDDLSNNSSIAIGNNALKTTVNSVNNLAIGYGSLENNTNKFNIAIGHLSMNKNTSGTYNLGLGHYSMNNNTTGQYNLAFGNNSMYLNTTGEYNTALSHSAMYYNRTGSYNVAIGYYALRNNSNGAYNTAIGYYTGFNVRGNGNVMLGNHAGYYEEGSERLYIENSLKDSSQTLIWGNFLTNQLRLNAGVGINVDPPLLGLEVAFRTEGYVVDQENINSTGSFPSNTSYGLQEFTAGVSGDLVALELRFNPSRMPDSVYVEITSGGTVLFADSLDLVSDWNTLPVSGLSLTQGEKYVIHVWEASGWYYSDDNPYAGGYGGSSGRDMVFRTIIDGYANNGASFKVDSAVTINNYTLPTADGTSGQVMTTNGSGQVSWTTGMTDTDDQTLSLSGTELTIVDGNTVDLASILPTIDTLPLITDADGDTKIQVEETTDDDIIRFDVKGTEVAVIRNDKIGVGVTNPNAKLDVDGTIRLNNNDLLFRHGTDTYHGLGWRNSVGGSTFAGFSPNGPVLYGYDGGVLGTTGGGERSVLNWTQDGYVGIGTTGPDASLDLVGTFQFVDGNQQNGYVLTSDGSGNATWQANVVDTDDQTLSLSGTELTIVDGNTVDLSSLVDDGDWTVSGTKMYNLNSGYVGIGTTNPSQELHVVNNTTTGFTTIEVENNASGGGANIIFDTDNVSNAQVGVNGSGHSSHPNTLFVYNDNHPLRLYAGGGDRIYIASNGKIGINNTDPQEDLHIDGSLRIQDGTQQNGYILTSDANGTATWQAPVTDTLTMISDADGDTKIQVEESTDEDVIHFDVDGTEAMVIGSTGGVGVNTDAPDKGLKVAMSGYENAVDQSLTSNNRYFTASVSRWQSFTAGVSGDLTAVSVKYYLSAPAPDSVTITIYEGTGTGGSLLYTDRIEIVSNWVTLNITGVQVTAGSVYSIGVDNVYGFIFDNRSAYPNGSLNNSSTDDASFITYVTGYHTQGSFSVDSLVNINDYSFPSADGTSGQIMTTDGAGNLNWTNATIDTDDQTLSLSGTELTITDGNTVDLNSLINDGDWTVNGNDLYNSNSGNVGIGTASPEVSLHVIGNGTQPVALFEETNTPTSIALVGSSEGMRLEFNPSNNDLRLQTSNVDGSFGGTVLATFKSTGDVGIGITDPDAALHVIGNGSQPVAIFEETNASPNIALVDATNGMRFEYNTNEDELRIQTANTDGTYGGDLIAVFEASGNVGIGTTSPGHTLEVEGAATGDYVTHIKNTATSNTNTTQYNGLKITAGRNTRNGVNSRMIAFHTPDNTEIGRIHQNGNTSVSYMTSSDVRLKMNIAPTKFGIADLMNIQVKDYEFKSEPGFVRTGYLAQDLYNVYPEAVSKGGEDVKSDPWMVDYGAMTPLLVKSIQDQQQEIEELKQELRELKQLIEKN